MIKKTTAAFARNKVPEPVEAPSRSATKDPNRTRTLSVKVDADRYKRMNRARFDLDMSGQDIMIEALDMWLLKKKM